MKMSFIFLLALLFTLVGCGKAKQVPTVGKQGEGHETGNGTDNKPFAGAWVLGENSEITYCTVIASDFGVDRGTILKEIDQAFTTWREYIIAKKVNDAILSRAEARKNLFLLPIKSRLLPKCNGKQNVTFHFGHEDRQISKIKKKYVNPTAFAEVTLLNTKTGSSQGVVWLVKEGGLLGGKGGYPEWNLPNRLLGILTHEIGHIYGIGHVEETIMQEDMWGLLLNSNHTTHGQPNIEYKLAHIDHAKELYVSEDDTDQMYQGTVAYNGEGTSDQERKAAEETFKLFTNKKPKGEMVTKFIDGNFTLQDEEESFSFNIVILSKHYTGHQQVFSVLRTWDQVPGESTVGHGFHLYHQEKVMVGEIETESGRKFSIIIEKNQGPPVSIKYFKDGQAHSLMMMDTYFSK